MNLRISILTVAAILLPLCASADLIESYDGPPAGSVTTAFDGGGAAKCGDGPQSAIDAGFEISSTGPACFSYSGLLNLDDNGIWFDMPAIADQSGATAITIDLGGYYSYAGSFMNFAEFFDWDTGLMAAGDDPVVAALDGDGNVLQSYDILYDYGGQYTDVNQGFYVGISSPDLNIRYLRISGSGIAASGISTVLPEPSTGATAVLAMALAALIFRRSRSRADGTRDAQ